MDFPDWKFLTIKQVGRFKDGSAEIYRDKKGNFLFRETRLSAKNFGFFYDKYPTDKDAKIIEKTAFHIVSKLYY